MLKNFHTWLILDIKTGKFRVLSSKLSRKSLNGKLKGTEVPIDLSMNVDVPEVPILKARGEIKLSQMEISELLLSEMTDQDEDQTKLQP